VRVPGGDYDAYVESHVRQLEALRRAGIVECLTISMSIYRPVAASGKVTVLLINGDEPIALRPAEKCEATPLS
jgi:hypothetical protein